MARKTNKELAERHSKNRGGNPAWTKGMESPNPKGAALKKPFYAMVMLELKMAEDAPFEKVRRGDRLRKIARNLVKAGCEGDMEAIIELRNMLDGKPNTQVTMTDQDGKAVTGIRIEFYDPEPRDD